ncbi:MAG: helix-turn-helix domain-containing protein [Defluviitaleaceae bacterium]|nr:helix-turn-helix domain-containing protein [Defluviitaleaceae bacterium]
MDGSALKIFCEHIEKNFLDEEALKKAAEKLGFPESSLRSWLNYQRTPSIRSLDKIANRIGCLTYQLIRNQPLEFGKHRDNNSNIPLRINLSKFFADNGCRFMAQKLSLLQHQVTEDMLKSYLRIKDYRIPSLQKLEAMAQALGVETHKLLFMEG